MIGAICLNADLGELDGEAGRALDAEMLAVVSRCALACGGHAGDAASMHATLMAAHANGVQVGAHPSYPDRENFGRRTLEIRLEDLLASLSGQIEALMAMAAPIGVPVAFVKPHGALYNDAARSVGLAECIAEATSRAGISTVMGPPRSALTRAAAQAGLSYISEGFIDRLYQPDGALTPRTLQGAVIEDPDTRVAQAMSIATKHLVKTSDGTVIDMPVQTLCLHGDTAGAADSARAIRAALTTAGIAIEARDP